MSVESLFTVTALDRRLGSGATLSIRDFSLDANRCVLLRGDNGAGKTTLLKILAGLLHADSLSATFEGQRIDARSAPGYLKRHVVYLHQHPYMFDASVASNIAYGLKVAGTPAAERSDRVREGLQWARLESEQNRNARELSGGERQRLALVRALALKPALMLLDEPTAGMARHDTNATIDLLKQIKEGGMTKVIIEHDMHVVFSLADRISVLAGGRIIAQGTPEEIKNNPKVKEAYLGEEQV